ncbi:hypothetical protein CTZ27_12190 [Streptomyces griseocarneus]|nr:hypothetical protein CTZ27_12190 [Streptomyces griseocarneus]
MQHRLLFSAALTALALLALPGCSGGAGQHAEHSPSPSPCRAPRKAVLPHTDGMLTEDDGGARVCAKRGQVIAVFLNAHTQDRQDFWTPITAHPEKSVRRENTGVMTLPIGVTAALFSPTATGDVELASRRKSGATWKATLVVR